MKKSSVLDKRTYIWNRSCNTTFTLFTDFYEQRASLVAQMVKNAPTMWETCVPSLGWGECWSGHGNPLQYSCLENSIDRGAWRAAVPRVARSQS